MSSQNPNQDLNEVTNLFDASIKNYLTKNSPNGLPGLLNQRQVAQILGMSVAWVERARWAGNGPKFIKIGRSVRYDPFDVMEYKNANPKQTISCKKGGAK